MKRDVPILALVVGAICGALIILAGSLDMPPASALAC
jgi:uncharacterized membrane protein YoaK (UPF0700 family)